MMGEEGEPRRRRFADMFDEEERGSPEHDKMVIRAMDHRFLEENIMKQFFDWWDDKFMVRAEVPIKSYNGYITGYWDLVINAVIRDGAGHYYPKEIYMEVKPYVYSFGQTLRQINTYRASIPQYKSSIMVLYTRDETYVDAFKKNDVKVILEKEGENPIVYR